MRSPDELDLAAEREELERQSALALLRKQRGPAATGACLYCNERLPLPMRWCNADCRNEWQELNPNR